MRAKMYKYDPKKEKPPKCVHFTRERHFLEIGNMGNNIYYEIIICKHINCGLMTLKTEGYENDPG